MSQKRKNKDTQKINYFKEVGKLFKNLFRKDFIQSPLLEQPQELKKAIFKKNLIVFIFDSIAFNIFSYLLLAGNYAIEHGFAILGIGLYILHESQSIFSLFYLQWKRNEMNKIELMQSIAITEKYNTLINKVKWHIYESEDNGKGKKQRQCTNEELSNCITGYITSYWSIQNNYWINIGQIFVALAMLIGTIATNTVIPQKQFILLILSTSIVALLGSGYDFFYWKETRIRNRKIRNEKSALENDTIRGVPIIEKDAEARTKKYKELCKKDFEQEKKFIKKDIFSDLIVLLVQVVSSSWLIIAYAANYDKITLETVAGLLAVLAIFNKAIRSFSSFIKVLDNSSRNWQENDQERTMMENILNVHNKKTSLLPQKTNSFLVNAFELSYNALSSNEIPFRLILEKVLKFVPSDCIALTGASGSGKSTFLKIITSRIIFKGNDSETIAPINYTFFDETIDFGSSNLFEEMFCLDYTDRIEPSKEEYEKMLEILKGLQLYTEISENCKDFWLWMKENKSETLSKGQKQRMIVAKILFWLNDSVDVIALDECTSGLDAEASNDTNNADAQKILKFIIDYCNRDKKRIIFLATHQNIDAFCNHKLHFRRKNGQTVIQEIY